MDKSKSHFAIFLTSLISLICIFNISFGINFPIPWVDESWFLWQALSFSNNNSLLAPELISDRPVMWMQPGYILALGTYLKLIDFSLRNAREFSLIFYLIACTLYCKVIYREKDFINLFFVSVIFLLPSSLASSNIARMESLILALAIGTLLSTINKHYFLAIALSLISVLVHFNGVYFFFIIIFAFWMDEVKLFSLIRAVRWYEVVLLVCAIVSIMCYGFYILENIEAFKIDMAFQFSRKLDRKPFFEDMRALFAILFGIFILISKVMTRQRKDSLIAFFALMAILVFANGQEMWYQIFRNIGIGTLLLFFLQLTRPSLRLFLATGMMGSFIYIAGGVGFVGMQYQKPNSDYLSDNVINSLKNNLLEIKNLYGDVVSVSFNNTGADLLLYEFFRTNNILVIRRMPPEISVPRQADLCVYLSGLGDPIWIRNDLLGDLPDPALCKHGLFMSRTSIEAQMMTSSEYKFFHENLLNEIKK